MEKLLEFNIRNLLVEARDNNVYIESHSKRCQNAFVSQIAHQGCWRPQKTMHFEVWELQGAVHQALHQALQQLSRRGQRIEEYGRLQDKFLKNGRRELQWQSAMPKMELALIPCQGRR